MPLARFTTFGIGGPARHFLCPRDVPELAALVAALAAADVPLRVLGGGSNVLASDEGVDGAVVRLAGDFARLAFEGRRVDAGAAVPLARLVRECAERGLSGVEGLVGIPGTVGGALVMNAGGRWGRIGDVVETARVLGACGAQSLTREEAGFRYRGSALSGRIVLGAGLLMKESDPAQVAAWTCEYYEAKKAGQDMTARSAGCVFKNPDGRSAGALIDQAGLKGARVGDAEVSAVHANYIVNTGTATARDVLALVEVVRKGVREAFNVELELEIELW